MKLRLCKILYQIVSYLSDRANGTFSLLVRYKLVLGCAIITLSSTSCGTNHNPYITCYDISIAVMPQDTTVADTNKTNIDIAPNQHNEHNESNDL